MKEIQNNQINTNARRTFIQKFLGIITAAVLLPGISKLFASTNKWKELSSAGNGLRKPLGEEAYMGEICIVAFNYPPENWANCYGQLLPISENMALFSLLGINYGGNGTTNFGLPDLRSRFALGAGQGNELTNRNIGEMGGSENYSLISTEIPNHFHSVLCKNGTGNSADPTDRFFANDSLGTAHYGTANINANYLYYSGNNLAHNNMPPYLALNFIICLYGNYPSRS